MADKDYPINELVRVRIGSGKDAVEKNMGRALAETSDGIEILDDPIYGPDGRMLDEVRADGRASKPKTSVAGAAAAKKAASSATDEKEQA